MERFFRTIALGCAALSAGLPSHAAADGGFAPRIIYVTETGAGEGHRFQLVVANADGRNQRVVATSREPLMSPAWSPDGRQVAYVGYQHGDPQIYVRDLQTGSMRRMVDQPGVNGSPAWSPDGKSLALCLSVGGNRDIYVIDLDTGARQRLTDDAANDAEPAWSPDGSQIAFTSDRSGEQQIYSVSISGGAAQQLTADEAASHPGFSPDGESLAFVSHRAGTSRVALMELQTHAVRYVSPGPADDNPTFALDGAALLYQSRQDSELALVTKEGLPLERIAARGALYGVAWSAHAALPASLESAFADDGRPSTVTTSFTPAAAGR